MKVILPRSCTGQEVLDAFFKAAIQPIDPKRRWRPHEINEGFVIGPNSKEARPCRKSIKVSVARLKTTYAFLFFGKRGQTWVDADDSRLITLAPIDLDRSYLEVNISLHVGIYTRSGECDGLHAVEIDDGCTYNENFKPWLDLMMKAFFEILA